MMRSRLSPAPKQPQPPGVVAAPGAKPDPQPVPKIETVTPAPAAAPNPPPVSAVEPMPLETAIALFKAGKAVPFEAVKALTEAGYGRP